MPSNNIIIFDLWQTLADTTFKPSDLFEDLLHMNKTIIKKDFFEKLFKSDLYTKDISLEKGLSGLLSDLGILNRENLKKAIVSWKEMSQKNFLIEGAETLLINLKTRGYKLCLLTNIDKYGYENFPYKNLLTNFDYKFLSYSEGLRKPDKKCWEVIKNYYKVGYEDMVMIGDSMENDIFPAKQLKLSTVLIDVNNKKNVYNDVYINFLNS
ncbi:MAG: HAD family hydrolase [bacterium]